MRALALGAVLAATSTASASAQASAHAAPERGSAQRRAILAALRPTIEAKLGREVRFVPSCMQVFSGWAFVSAEPQRRDGRRIDPASLPGWQERDGVTVTALLRYRAGGWKLVDQAIGATDAWFDGRAPRLLFRQPCS